MYDAFEYRLAKRGFTVKTSPHQTQTLMVLYFQEFPEFSRDTMDESWENQAWARLYVANIEMAMHYLEIMSNHLWNVRLFCVNGESVIFPTKTMRRCFFRFVKPLKPKRRIWSNKKALDNLEELTMQEHWDEYVDAKDQEWFDANSH